MKKFETGGYYKSGALIEEVEVTRETESSIFKMKDVWGEMKECRQAKRSDWLNIHDTWEAAHQFLIDRQQEKVEYARKQLERENGKFGQIKGIRKPEAA